MHDYTKTVKHIETHGTRDGAGGYRLVADEQLMRLISELAPRCLKPAEIDDGNAVWAPFEPTTGTVQDHAARCWRLSKESDDGTYHFPAEAMHHLRLAAGITVEKA